MRNLIITISIALVLVSCGQNDKKEIVKEIVNPYATIEWVQGVWVNRNSKTESYETWLRNDKMNL
jgi:hypothetical protein